MSSVFKASLLLTVFFGINKVVALVRQTLIARQFGFSSEIDAFHVANNIPDLIFSLFSGGALALAFIPVFAEYIEEYGRITSWKLFSKIANLLFLATLLLSIFIAIIARPLVIWQFGISPGFSAPQQELVIELMRINLIALLLFSLSGLVMASLQAHKHFLLTAIAPILYNIGLIIGALILAPSKSVSLGGIYLPAFGLGIHGLVYGTILGALLHLGVQIPGLLMYKFRWAASIDFQDKAVRKVLRLMGPRIATVFLIQLMFIARDNFASRLPQGSVTALTYGYFIVQVPETLIGTAIATALLPTLSELVSQKKQREFAHLINKTLRIIITSTIAISVFLSIVLPYAINIVFDFNGRDAELLTMTTRGYLIGLMSHSLLEIVARAFYAKQNAKLPLIATFIRTVLFLLLGFLFFQKTGAPGLAGADSIATTVELMILLYFLYKIMPSICTIKNTIVRSVIGSAAGATAIIALLSFLPLTPWLLVPLALLIGTGIFLLFVREEMKMIVKM